ncbi:MAG: alpha/beta hydrolase [Blautia sp.]|nr:alpha/beta hydrolase [Blautia sp.]
METGIYNAQLEIVSPEGNADSPGTVLIFPGGGYSHLSDREAMPVARFFTSGGIRAAILTYDVETEVLGTRPLEQAAWAVGRLRRLYPGEPVTVLGFSAGAHCAASLGVHWRGMDWNGRYVFDAVRRMLTETDSGTELAQTAFRPDAMILAYPVITSGSYAHMESIERLIGRKGQWIQNKTEYKKALEWTSLETQADNLTPRTFIWHTESDRDVPVENSLMLMKSLHKAKVPVELHIYPEGVHGLSLATKEVEQPEKERYADAHIATWAGLALDWYRRYVQ